MQMLHLSLSPVWEMNFNMHFGTDLISSVLAWVNLQFSLCSSLQWFLCDFSRSLMPLFAIGLSSSRCLWAVLLYSICFDKPSGFSRFPKCLPPCNLSFWQPPVPTKPSFWLSPWVRDSYFSMEVLTHDKEWSSLWKQWDVIGIGKGVETKRTCHSSPECPCLTYMGEWNGFNMPSAWAQCHTNIRFSAPATKNPCTACVSKLFEDGVAPRD